MPSLLFPTAEAHSTAVVTTTQQKEKSGKQE